MSSNSDRSQGNKTMERRKIDLRSKKRLFAKMSSANKNYNLLLITKQITIATFSEAKTLAFSTMIKNTQLYKIIDGRRYKK